MRSDQQADYLSTQTYYLVAGVTNAVYLPIQPGLLQTQLNFITGGSLLMIAGSTAGGTLTAAQLAAYHNSLSFAQVSNNSVHHIDGPAGFYIAAIGATVVAAVIREFSSPNGV